MSGLSRDKMFIMTFITVAVSVYSVNGQALPTPSPSTAPANTSLSMSNQAPPATPSVTVTIALTSSPTVTVTSVSMVITTSSLTSPATSSTTLESSSTVISTSMTPLTPTTALTSSATSSTMEPPSTLTSISVSSSMPTSLLTTSATPPTLEPSSTIVTTSGSRSTLIASLTSSATPPTTLEPSSTVVTTSESSSTLITSLMSSANSSFTTISASIATTATVPSVKTSSSLMSSSTLVSSATSSFTMASPSTPATTSVSSATTPPTTISSSTPYTSFVSSAAATSSTTVSSSTPTTTLVSSATTHSTIVPFSTSTTTSMSPATTSSIDMAETSTTSSTTTDMVTITDITPDPTTEFGSGTGTSMTFERTTEFSTTPLVTSTDPSATASTTRGITCLIPSVPPDLMTPDLRCLSDVTFGTTCMYMCDEGFYLSGESQVTCLMNGSLSAPLPTCEAVVCQLPDTFPSLLSSSSIGCIEGGTIGYAAFCRMECSMGFRLIGDQSISCQGNGTLSGQLPQCDAVDTYVVSATFPNKTFASSLRDSTSFAFAELAQELVNYIQPKLQNNFSEPVLVTVNGFSAGSVIADFSVIIDVENRSSFQNLENLASIQSTMVTIAQQDPTYMDPGSIATFSTVTCPQGILITPYGSTAMFNSATVNVRANSTNATCPYYTERDGEPIEAVCVGDYIRPSNWVIPAMNCGRNLTSEEILEILSNMAVTAENAAVVAEEVADFTEMNENISTNGLGIIATLLEDINSVNSTEPEVAESIVEIADSILSLPDDTLGSAEEENNSPSRIVLALEAQLAIVEVENGSSRFVESNVAAEVLDVGPSDISQGYTVIMSVTDDGESISDRDFRVRGGDLTQGTEATQSEATLFIPSGLADSLLGRRGRLVFTTYLMAGLFQDVGLAQINEGEESFNRTPNSRIMSASVNNMKVEDLDEPVRISFVPLNPNGTNAQCVFWDFNENAWSGRGCIQVSNDTNGRIECECNHLTNFGILMDIYGGEGLSDEADFILKIISYIGCLISIWGLLLTILTYATNKKLRDRKPNQILLSLSSALLGLYVIFLVMISLDQTRNVSEISILPCSILAAILQYFILASIFWMGVEGFNMYNLFVLVLNAYMPDFLKKASLVAWGCPLLIVGITAGASRQYYSHTDFCFPQFWPLIGGLLIPIGVVMIFNVVIYVRVLMRLNKTVKGKHLDKTEKRQRIRRFQNAVCILTLMGLTWSIGYLSVIRPASAVVQGIFTVLNSLQGYFIFMLYCIRQPKVRRIWRSQFKCCLPKSFTTPSTINSGSGQTNSSSARPRTQDVRRTAAGLASSSESSGFRADTVLLPMSDRLQTTSHDNAVAADW
ncbi:mucin-2-like isoform X2 [Lytechinus pictus]|uniref:mucin-2-like isoform X2 n=1 Tax=Lytechinus pictus TaxID=7653 RepID=UPI0030BA102D